MPEWMSLFINKYDEHFYYLHIMVYCIVMVYKSVTNAVNYLYIMCLHQTFYL